MPANAWQVHAEIDRTVCKVDECLRAFAECWEHAKVVAGTKDKEKHATEWKKVISLLRQHKAQIRKWTTQNSVPLSSKDKLKDAQARIDRDLRRFQEFEQALTNQASQAPGQENIAPTTEGVKPARPDASNGAAPTGEAEGAPSEVKVQWDQLLRDGAEDSEMIEEFVCKICQVHVVGCNPKLSRCSHLYCGDCIAEWFAAHPRSQTWAQRAQAAGAVPCPVCKEPLKEDTDLFPVCAGGRTESVFLYRMLSGLKIMCANNPKCRADGKCDWIGEYGSFQEHMRECKNVPLGKPLASKERPPSQKPAEAKPRLEEERRAPEETTSPAQCQPADEGPQEVAAVPEESSASAAIVDAVTKPQAPGSDGAEQPPAVVDEAPDAEAAAARGAEPEHDTSAAASTTPASLTDLIQALVNLKVQEYSSRKEASEAEPAEPAQEPPAQEEEVSAEPEAQAQASAAVPHCVAIAFAASGPAQLTLAAGDLVQVLDRSETGWTYGRLLLTAAEGWFPEWAIQSQ